MYTKHHALGCWSMGCTGYAKARALRHEGHRTPRRLPLDRRGVAWVLSPPRRIARITSTDSSCVPTVRLRNADESPLGASTCMRSLLPRRVASVSSFHARGMKRSGVPSCAAILCSQAGGLVFSPRYLLVPNAQLISTRQKDGACRYSLMATYAIANGGSSGESGVDGGGGGDDGGGGGGSSSLLSSLFSSSSCAM